MGNVRFWHPGYWRRSEFSRVTFRTGLHDVIAWRAPHSHACVLSPQAQYIFIHDALAEAITCGTTEFNVRELMDRLRVLNSVVPDSGKSLMASEFLVSLTISYMNSNPDPVPAVIQSTVLIADQPEGLSRLKTCRTKTLNSYFLSQLFVQQRRRLLFEGSHIRLCHSRNWQSGLKDQTQMAVVLSSLVTRLTPYIFVHVTRKVVRLCAWKSK